jgi:SAM-dependent methyltransferase
MDEAVDWNSWLERWDRQQSSYMEDRERRFSVMFDALQAIGPPTLALDLACGPGSLSSRLLDRFPGSRVVAVDYDPVLLRIGKETLARFDRRMSWVEGDLRGDSWTRSLPSGRFDAILSTTALHWLSEEELTRLYRSLPGLLRPGGVFLNGDHLRYEADQTGLDAVARSASAARRARRTASGGAESWDDWWKRLSAEPGLREQFAERGRRFPGSHHREENLSTSTHERALRSAGFTEVGTIWQEFDDRVLMAIR